ncbi:hypothetical protein HNR00_002185 [Methylorubrum rhodinum]|uniref:Uncharacterized protein n=1 Tax=Methylorubrum rhodinum TaxID=29428 RepID=A0A840ZHI0_9HYPH|nr:hypothetical protein [Methylorubrum rhodinum]MBB5757472.1 hypothetical protein [Methylorubrum rhodinum]
MADADAVFAVLKIVAVVAAVTLFFWRLLHGRMSLRDFRQRYWWGSK